MKEFIHFYGHTFKNIIKQPSIFTTMILSVIIYSFFYPIAYQGQQAESLPIIIVDQENSVLTQKIISEVSRSPNIKIQAVTGNFLEAQQMIQMQKADGILLLPDHLSQSVLRGETGGIGIYLSAAYFLKTKQIGLGLANAIEQTLNQYLERFGQITHFNLSPSIHQIPLFNTLSGYGSYIFPAVAPLIIHQTIFLGLCMLIAGYRHPDGKQIKWHPHIIELFAIYAVALTIGTFACLYMFGFSFWFFDYPRGGNFWGMLLTVFIFVSCIINMAMFFASFLDMPERAGHVIVFSSIPLFLLTGAAWPHLAMPEAIQWLAWALPSTHGVQAFIQLNQMGASIYDVMPKLIYLSCLALIFAILAYYRLIICISPAIDHTKDNIK